ncbi:hypothetical protein H9P43_010167 [Blastocladiella emersonii ATCC 22665]|nr:hypothetical protein H9P43_010167 [Blastocladiella emersonii ATCC 22665]
MHSVLAALQQGVYPLTAIASTGVVEANYRVSVFGDENVAPSSPILLASTHAGMVMDPAILIATAVHKRQAHFWAKATVWNHPVMAFIFDGLGAVPY